MLGGDAGARSRLHAASTSLAQLDGLRPSWSEQRPGCWQRRDTLYRDYLLERVQGEFAEMPGMRLTFRQAQRLWALDARTCRRVLDTLVGNGFLTRSAEGAYAQASADPRTSKVGRFALIGDGQ